jgi:hypothetical protein
LNKQVHIVCPEIPLPSSAGDMIDTYFQLQFLHQAGYAVILHCFHDDADPDTTELQHITAQIHLYPRNQGHKGVSIRHPYCISSRSSPQLLENLLRHQQPVLFQGTSTTYYLPDLVDRGYQTVVRINGIASELYGAFTKYEKSLLKKAYSFNEARLIKKWEEKIAEKATIIATTTGDQQKFKQLYKSARTICLAPFIPVPEIKSLPGKGMYCLYYGDLSNPENEKAVHWLTENVFTKIPVPLVVADTGTVIKTEDQPHPESNICTIANPAETELRELIQKAQLILLPRCHNKGFDRRLLQALELGRFCICNDFMAENTGLEELFVIANDNDEMINTINQYFCRLFTEKDMDERKALLASCYTPRHALNKLLKMLEQEFYGYTPACDNL